MKSNVFVASLDETFWIGAFRAIAYLIAASLGFLLLILQLTQASVRSRSRICFPPALYIDHIVFDKDDPCNIQGQHYLQWYLDQLLVIVDNTVRLKKNKSVAIFHSVHVGLSLPTATDLSR